MRMSFREISGKLGKSMTACSDNYSKLRPEDVVPSESISEKNQGKAWSEEEVSLVLSWLHHYSRVV
jgi:hypothetical protein